MLYFTNLKDWFILRKFWFMICRYLRQCRNKTSEINPSQTIGEIFKVPMEGYISNKSSSYLWGHVTNRNNIDSITFVFQTSYYEQL